jgi:hypothetical protein
VYLFVEVAQLQVVNEVSTVEEFAELSIFYDADGVSRATFGDMVWQTWMEGGVSSDLGEHELRFEVPEGWHNVVDGKMGKSSVAALSRAKPAAWARRGSGARRRWPWSPTERGSRTSYGAGEVGMSGIECFGCWRYRR